MEAYLPISFLNDFIFCPRSIYFHQLYGRVSQKLYQTTDQTAGLAAHKSIDQQRYTTAATVLQGLEVYSQTYNLMGKIDTFDLQSGLLTERKKRIKVIYDGYIFQLYAQYYALTEMGYTVKKLKLYSLDDNKSYAVKLPADDVDFQQKFERLIHIISHYRLDSAFVANPAKCQRCIYANLCDHAKLA